ncbi:unnamed protein product [Chrysoparadoxa australica]
MSLLCVSVLDARASSENALYCIVRLDDHHHRSATYLSSGIMDPVARSTIVDDQALSPCDVTLRSETDKDQEDPQSDDWVNLSASDVSGSREDEWTSWEMRKGWNPQQSSDCIYVQLYKPPDWGAEMLDSFRPGKNLLGRLACQVNELKWEDIPGKGIKACCCWVTGEVARRAAGSSKGRVNASEQVTRGASEQARASVGAVVGEVRLLLVAGQSGSEARLRRYGHKLLQSTGELYDRLGHYVDARHAAKYKAADDLALQHEDRLTQLWAQKLREAKHAGDGWRDSGSANGNGNGNGMAGAGLSQKSLNGKRLHNGCSKQGTDPSIELTAPASSLSSLCCDLVWEGVPAGMREDVYMILSGGAGLKTSAGDGYYQQLLQIWDAFDAAGDVPEGLDAKELDRVSHEIDLDLNRVFHRARAKVNTKEGVRMMRRVLRAYAIRNPSVGYCQGLSFLDGILLDVVSEEASFWLLAVMCERIGLEYYTKNMAGTRAAVEALSCVVKRKLPQLHHQMGEMGIPFELVAMQWVLVHFVNCFPASTALRVIEVSFVHGPQATMAVALAFLRLHEPALIQAASAGDLVEVLAHAKSGMHDANLLLRQAQRELRDHGDEIACLRRQSIQKVAAVLDSEQSQHSDVPGGQLDVRWMGLMYMGGAVVNSFRWFIGHSMEGSNDHSVCADPPGTGSGSGGARDMGNDNKQL